MATDQTTEPLVTLRPNDVTIDEARRFEETTGLTFAEGLSLLITNRLSAVAAQGFLELARLHAAPEHKAQLQPKTYMDLLGLFTTAIAFEFDDPKEPAPD